MVVFLSMLDLWWAGDRCTPPLSRRQLGQTLACACVDIAMSYFLRGSAKVWLLKERRCREQILEEPGSLGQLEHLWVSNIPELEDIPTNYA